MLAEAQAAAWANWVPRTVDDREKYWGEFRRWCEVELEKSPDAATLDDVIVYAQHHFVREHAGCMLADGRRVAAPSSLAGMLSHLTTSYRLMGRDSPWNGQNGSGNPVLSTVVQSFKGGYANLRGEAGYSSRSAVPMTEEKAKRLVKQLEQEAERSQTQRARLLLLRDAGIVAYLWRSQRRAGDTAQQARIMEQAGGLGLSVTTRVNKTCRPSKGSRQPAPVELERSEWAGASCGM
jgi:hypothetical protein